MNNRNWHGNAVPLAILGLMGSTKSCPHVNSCEVSSLTEEGLVAIGGSNNDRGDNDGGGGGRFKKCRDSCDDSNYGQNDNNGQGDIGGGRGGGGGTGDVGGNGGLETRWRWRCWDWGEPCNGIFDRIATSLFYIIWNLKLGGIKIDGKILETTVKSVLYPLVMPIFDMLVSLLPALLPAIITAAIPAILVTTILALCYYHYWIVSAIVMSVFKFLAQAGLVVGSFLSFCLSLLG